MSHTVKAKTSLKNRQAIESAAQKLKGVELVNNGEVTDHKLYQSQTQTGLGVKLPGWNYPVVIDLDTGEVAYDNYNGHWGKQSELDKFLQRYSADVALQAAEVKGFSGVTETTLDNGDIKIQIPVGGGGSQAAGFGDGGGEFSGSAGF